MKREQKSIVEMNNGAIIERIDYEMGKVLDNIADPNTDARKKRSIIIQLDIEADAERVNLTVSTTVKTKLQPTNSIKSAVYLTADAQGNQVALEMTPQIPGQFNLDGTEQEPPAQIKIVREA